MGDKKRGMLYKAFEKPYSYSVFGAVRSIGRERIHGLYPLRIQIYHQDRRNQHITAEAVFLFGIEQFPVGDFLQKPHSNPV